MAITVQAQGELEIRFNDGQYGDSGSGTISLSGTILVSPADGSILETVSQGSFTVNSGGLLPAGTYSLVTLPGGPPATWPATWPTAWPAIIFPGGENIDYYDQVNYSDPSPNVVMGLLFADANYFTPGNGPATGLELWEQNNSAYLAAGGPGISFNEPGAVMLTTVAVPEPKHAEFSALALLALDSIRRKFLKLDY